MISNPQTVGTVSGQPIVADLGGRVEGRGLVRVTLTADYAMAAIPGYPSRPPAGSQPPFYPQTLPGGGTFAFLAPEADALVAAGAATYV